VLLIKTELRFCFSSEQKFHKRTSIDLKVSQLLLIAYLTSSLWLKLYVAEFARHENNALRRTSPELVAAKFNALFLYLPGETEYNHDKSLLTASRGVKLTTHFQLVPRSIKRGCIHQLPHRSSCSGAALSHTSTATTLQFTIIKAVALGPGQSLGSRVSIPLEARMFPFVSSCVSIGLEKSRSLPKEPYRLSMWLIN
jgi:hypothetical protein